MHSHSLYAAELHEAFWPFEKIAAHQSCHPKSGSSGRGSLHQAGRARNRGPVGEA